MFLSQQSHSCLEKEQINSLRFSTIVLSFIKTEILGIYLLQYDRISHEPPMLL